MTKQLKYTNLDFLRAFAAIMIVFLHVRANGPFLLPKGIDEFVAISGSYVQLFFLISGFSLCCGYYEKMKESKITLNDFYKKRYFRIWPFFALLVLIDVLSSFIFNYFNFGILTEAFADLTLVFGLLPFSNISVIGVGWALGVIFGFYIIFPFFVFLLWNKKRAWFSLIISMALYYCCEYYFVVDSSPIACNTIRWLCYFILGGIIYLYKENIISFMNKNIYIRIICAILCIGSLFGLIYSPKSISGFDIEIFVKMFVFSFWIVYSISFRSHFLSNKVTTFLSTLSFNIYLSHMFIYRITEKLKLTHIFNNDFASFLCCSIIVIGVSILISFFYEYIIRIIIKKKGEKYENSTCK